MSVYYFSTYSIHMVKTIVQKNQILVWVFILLIHSLISYRTLIFNFNRLSKFLLKLKDVSNNKLMAVPDSLAELGNLIKLNLSFNNLKSLPPAVSGMKSKHQIVPGLADGFLGKHLLSLLLL